jgi:DNA-directed RNA polymerase specialized sigma54-like protein
MERPPWKSKKKKVAPPGRGKATSRKKRQPNYKAISSRSTATSDQHARVLELLRIADQTTYNLRAHGIAQCATRVYELKAQGYPITKTIVSAVDSDGYMHVGVALYSLKEVAPC